MTKRILAILATLALLLCAMPLAAVSADETSTFWWRNGGMNSVTEEGYQHVTEFRDGYYWLRSHDVRASVAGHNLDDGPYYMAIGQKGRIPTGHWLQITVSNGERNPNWFGDGDIRIQFPNPNNGPLVIKSKNTGKDYNGPVFMTNTAYVLKFAKEQENGVDVLVIYINGQKVFSGAKELAIFSGDKIWFNTNCNYKGGLAANDSLGIAPVFLNPNLGDFEEPEYYFQSMTKGGKTSSALLYYVKEDLFTLYDENGYAHAVMNCGHDDAGGGGMVGESVATEIANVNQKFEVTINPYVMYSGNWNTFGIYNTEKGIMSPAQNGDMIRIAYNAGGKATVNYYYGTASSDYVSLIPTTAISWRNDQKFQFELVEGEVAVINVSLNGELKSTIYETDANVAGFFDIMRAATLRMAQVGHKAATTAGADVFYLKVADDIVEEVPVCEHEYFDACDPVCLLCGELREVSHNVIHVEENAPSCTENGNVEYWYCDKCGAAWLDEAGTIVTNLQAVKLGATCAANAVHNEGIPAGCHYTGMQENWYCATCDVYYLDAACTVITNYKSLTIPALGGEVEHFTAKDATCNKNGNIEYWVCYECEQVWQDAALTQLTNIKNVVIGATGEHEYFYACDQHCMNCGELTNPDAAHNVTHVPELIPTDCQTMGNREFWYCTDCNTVWDNAECTGMPLNMMMVKTGYGAHSYVDGICDLCGEIDPEYAVVVETKTIGTVTYTVMQRADGTYKLVISGTGAVKALTTTYAYDEVIIEEGITEIASKAFSGNAALKNITFPESLEAIGNKAFMNSGLVSVTLADGVVLGQEVFYGCASLEEAYIGNIKALDDGGVKRSWIPTASFRNCTALTFVSFGDGLNTIQNAAFKNTGLEHVYIPGNIKIVSNTAFDSCANLTTVEIEEGVKTLAFRVFAGCKKLTNVTVPSSVTTLGAGVFRSCYGLENAVLNSTVAVTDETFFDNRVLTSVTLAEGTPSIDWRSFFKCTKLESIVIPESVTAIGELVFYNCLSLTEIVIPANVKTIGEKAFENCKALATVYVDSAVVAAGLTSDKAMGYLARYATTVAFAEGIDAPAYIAENFANVTTAEVDGILYTVYSK